MQYFLETISAKLSNKKILMTGGTGFFGKSLLDFIKRKGIELDLTILSRNPEKFVGNYPKLAEGIKFVQGDLLNFSITSQKFEYLIHAGTTVSGVKNVENAFSILNDIISGTRNVLKVANTVGVKKILNISSGAVYGNQPRDIVKITEEYSGAPDISNPVNAYAEGKRVAELMCAINNKIAGIEYVNARCFAFIGKYLPLDSHFAIGNFIGNGLKGEAITIKGDGTPIRAYMYADDLVYWLFILLLFGENRQSYNVGSDEAYSIEDVAKKVAVFFPGSKVSIEKKVDKSVLPARYLPSVKKCRSEFGLSNTIDLNEAVKLTVESLREL